MTKPISELMLQRFKNIAIRKGGSCSSENYISFKEKLEFNCSEGHQWKTRPGEIARGNWCPICARIRNGLKRRSTLKDMITIAESRKGFCLASNYAGSHKKLHWKCHLGHIWEAMPSRISSGSWCPVCSRQRVNESRRLSIEAMKAFALRKRGICLSDQYINAQTKLRWKCKAGHAWEAAYSNIYAGKWCPTCARIANGLKRRLNLEEFKTLALNRGGECLSKKYHGRQVKLKWKCAKGHIWEAKPSAVKFHKTWCPHCAGNARGNIQKALDLAESRGGVCLSKDYKNANQVLTWRCHLGHAFKNTYSVINRGVWCPECAAGIGERICRAYFEFYFSTPFKKSRPFWLKSEQGNKLELDGFSEVMNLAFEHQGEQHYSTKTLYVKTQEQLRERRQTDRLKEQLCRINNVVLIKIPEVPKRLKIYRLGKYILKECQKKGIKIPVDKIHQIPELRLAYSNDQLQALNIIAELQGGKCISKEFLGVNIHLKWMCRNEHQWRAKPSKIKSGRWCPVCAKLNMGSSLRHSLDDMKVLAMKKNGICLSTQYKNARTKIKWQCSEGHIWEAIPSNIQKGHWCPKCGARRALKVKELLLLNRHNQKYLPEQKFLERENT